MLEKFFLKCIPPALSSPGFSVHQDEFHLDSRSDCLYRNGTNNQVPDIAKRLLFNDIEKESSETL